MGDWLCEINAVTLVTTDMARSWRFYGDLGFSVHYGGARRGVLEPVCRVELLEPPAGRRLEAAFSGVGQGDPLGS